MRRYDTVVRAARAVVDGREQAVDVGVTDGRVVVVEPLGALEADGALVVLADDEVLVPGLVDTHVHVNEPGRTEWEGFASATRAAAAGGVTTIVDMPLNSVPATTTPDALAVKQRAARHQAFVDVGFWGGAVPENLGTGDLAALHEAGVFGFKCFLLDSGVEEFPPLDADRFGAAMHELAGLDALMIVHAESGDLIADLAHGPAYRPFLDSRPSAAEQRAIALVIDTARATGGRAHVVHLSAAEAVPALRAARADGVRVSVETCPHYLALDAAEVPDGGTDHKCCPPIRDAANRDRLWAALAEGVIDCVVTDHSPSTADLKALDTGDFAVAWGGIASLQLGLAVVWTAARERGHTLAEVVDWMATGPADLVGLADRGRIAVGARADLAVLAPDETFVVDPARLHHKNPVTPYAGRTLAGVVRRTYLAGEAVDLDAAPRGRLISRPRSQQ
ncbi:allantoinase AllB [Nocardioides marinquilinus]|uniref:allantoinase n=1 Tax=Nocardioides marinquilinus TaxID=1210400 RepID=A0ABP9PM18_9ACTN